MHKVDLAKHFLDAAALWLCDDYGLDVRYIARQSDNGYLIWDAAITFGPLPHQSNVSFKVEASGIVAGRRHFYPVTKEAALTILEQAVRGSLTVDVMAMALERQTDFDYSSDMNQRDRWFFPLHLRIGARQSRVPTQSELLAIDGALRAATPPFDGLVDLAASLGLNIDFTGSKSSALTIHISPPVDIIFEQSQLSEDSFTATLHAHPKLEKSRVGFAVRAAPMMSPEGRKQLASCIVWCEPVDGRCAGTVQVALPPANSVPALLMLGETTVRRHWFADPSRAESQRYIALNQSDPELRQLRQALLERLESHKFEQAVAAMLFLLGFSPALPLETNAPDIVASTPQGRLMVVECTLGIGDFATKVGKLVDRRSALQKTLAAASLPSSVVAILVCRPPRDQVAALADDLVSHNVILIAGEDLVSGLDRVRFPVDPDRLLTEVVEKLEHSRGPRD